MNKNIYLIISLFIYLFLINFVANFLPFDTSFKENNLNQQIENNGPILNIYSSNSVSYQIIRHRWYGTIYDYGDKQTYYLIDPEKSSSLDFLRLPWGNFVYIHIIFLAIILVIFFYKRNKIKYEQPNVIYEGII